MNLVHWTLVKGGNMLWIFLPLHHSKTKYIMLQTENAFPQKSDSCLSDRAAIPYLWKSSGPTPCKDAFSWAKRSMCPSFKFWFFANKNQATEKAHVINKNLCNQEMSIDWTPCICPMEARSAPAEGSFWTRFACQSFGPQLSQVWKTYKLACRSSLQAKIQDFATS